MAWQQRARIGVALVGVAIAGLVYLTLGTREASVTPTAVTRVDPTAVIETAGADLQRLQGIRRDYRIEAARQLTYEDGTTSFLDLRVTVEDRAGRDFVITGGEAQVGVAESELAMVDGVALRASDGFALDTEEGIFSEATGVVAAPGPATFSRAGLEGTGVGMIYDTNADFLTIEAQTEVSLTDADGARIEFVADSLTFDRTRQVLALSEAVRIRRGGDVLEAERVSVELDALGERPTFIALRGNAVARTPGGAVEAMQAEAIDFDYSADGLVLERLALGGGSRVDLAGPAGGGGGQVRGLDIEVLLDANGGLRTIGAVGEVSLEVALDEGSVGVTADRLDGVGEAGALAMAFFEGSVAFAEAGAAARSAGAERLALELADGGVGLASFSGGARFASGDVSASGFQAEYSPGNGGLSLRGAIDAARPRVADGRVTIEAEIIDMLLDPVTVYAGGDVQTTIAGGNGGRGLRLPALVDGAQAVSVSGGMLEYGGDPALVRYSEGVVFWQGDTTIRAGRLEIDPASGNLLAADMAQATFALDGVASIATAPAIRFDEAARVLTYGALPVEGPDADGDPGVAAPARLSGAQGDLTAGDIVVRLAPSETVVEGIEARGDVRLLLDGRSATGDAMRYDAGSGAYVMEGTLAAPATLVDGCRRTEGRRLTFDTAGEQVVVEGGQQARSRTAGTPCADATVQP